MKIPIRNIFYLLAYSWEQVELGKKIWVEAEHEVSVLTLLTEILVQGVHKLRKQGFWKNYETEMQSVYGISGKMKVTETLRSPQFLQGYTLCETDNLSENHLAHHILVATIQRLVTCESTVKLHVIALKKLLTYLPENTNHFRLQKAHFQQVKLPVYLSHYHLLLNICELIYDNTLVNEHTGKFRFYDFQKDEAKMSRLFENFVRNFYKREQSHFRVFREDIKWQFLSDEAAKKYLPKMQTDISLQSPNRKIIIDTKFYQSSLKKNFDTQKIHSENLYQLFSYLKNIAHKDALHQQCEGILLYPTIEQTLDLTYQFEQHKIHIKTIDLSLPPLEIHQRLLEIVG